MSLPEDFPVIAKFTVHFKCEVVEVAVVELERRPPKEYFLVKYKGKEFLLSRFDARPDLWNGSLPLEEAKLLGEAIEEQTGYKLPLRPSNNPFKYKGEIKVDIESFLIKDTVIRRAKAPFTDCIYFQIILSDEAIITMTYSNYDGHESWLPEDNPFMSEEEYDLFTDLFQHFEKKYQLGLYEPLRHE